MAVELAEDAVMIRAPRQNALLLADDGLEHRPCPAHELDAVAAHEAARQVGVIPLLAPQAGRRRAVAVGRLLHIAVDLRIGMEHQVLADEAGRIGKAVREAAGCRVEQQPRRADAVAGDDDDMRRLELLDAVLVVIDHARGHAVLVGGDLAHPAMGAQLDAGADRVRPIGDVGRGFCALRAGRRAMAEIDAARAALIVRGRDRRVRRPPVPAELVHGLADDGAGQSRSAAAASADASAATADRPTGPTCP